MIAVQTRTSPAWPPRRPRPFWPGYTLVELLATVAVLVVIFGLLISLGHRVRRESSDQVTRDILRRCREAMALYCAQNDNQPPPVPELLSANSVAASEAVLEQAALANNRAFVAALRAAKLISDPSDTIRDAWGEPIVFMPHMHPAVGMTVQGWFFFSAGPDRKFLTRDDNLYSYDQ